MLPFILIALGGLGIAVTTALEVVTAPYSAHVVVYPLNGAMHLLKVLAIAAFAGGVAGLVLGWRGRLGTVGSVAAGTLAVGTVVGAIPYSLAEASLDPSLTPSRANAQLEAIYAAQPWIGELSGFALPVIVLGIVPLGIVTLRRRLFPAWAPIASLATIPAAIIAVIGAEALGLPLPHPPAWIFLGLSAYGLAMLRPSSVALRDRGQALT